MRGIDPNQLVGKVLDSRYRIEQHLGSGAMGAVFRARHVRLPRAFAIKLLHPRLLSDAKLLKRFEREARLAGKLSHPNVVSVLDFGEVDGVAYMVMELAVGPRLSQQLARGPFARARAIRALRQLCDGLDHAHHHGLIHRDLKPENVIVDSYGGEEVARIVDFGIAILRDTGTEGPTAGPEARLTTRGLVLGTPHYMAPELATGRPYDHRVDLFALGVVAYEMLTGLMPFDGNGVEVLHANVNSDAPPMAERAPGVEVDPVLDVFTRRLMARDPGARPASAAAARAWLDQIERGDAAPGDLRSPPTGMGHSPPVFAARQLEPKAVHALGSAKTIAQGTLERPEVPASSRVPRDPTSPRRR